MQGRLFEDLVVTRRGGRAGGALPMSFAIHAAAITGLLAVSMAIPDTMPVPPMPPLSDVVFAAAPRVAVARGVPRATPRNASAPRPRMAPAFQAPADTPDEIVPDAFDPEPSVGSDCDGCVVGNDVLRPGDPNGVVGGDAPGTRAPVSAPVRPGGNIQQPAKIRHVDPVYPQLAQRAGVTGIVILECVIDREGRIRSVGVLRGHPLLDAAATDAVRQWTYRPTLLNGVPVEIVMTVTVRFATR